MSRRSESTSKVIQSAWMAVSIPTPMHIHVRRNWLILSGCRRAKVRQFVESWASLPKLKSVSIRPGALKRQRRESLVVRVSQPSGSLLVFGAGKPTNLLVPVKDAGRAVTSRHARVRHRGEEHIRYEFIQSWLSLALNRRVAGRRRGSWLRTNCLESRESNATAACHG